MSGPNTMLLDVGAWDLCLDAAGNIAMASAPYARAQDVASAIRLFQGELWYDVATYFEQQMVAAALRVPGVVSAQCSISAINGRTLTGQVTFTSVDGTVSTVALGASQ